MTTGNTPPHQNQWETIPGAMWLRNEFGEEAVNCTGMPLDVLAAAIRSLCKTYKNRATIRNPTTHDHLGPGQWIIVSPMPEPEPQE